MQDERFSRRGGRQAPRVLALTWLLASPGDLSTPGGDSRVCNPPAPAAAIRLVFEQALHVHVLESLSNHLRGDDGPGAFLAQAELHWPDGGSRRRGLPGEVAAAVGFYRRELADRDLGSVRLLRLGVLGTPTYAIHAETDGDDGWLEVYDERGTLVGAARTYLEFMVWGDRSAIRAQVGSGTLPAELQDAFRRSIWNQEPSP